LTAPAVIPATICRFRNRNTINGGMLMSKMLLDEHVVHIAGPQARLDDVVTIAAAGPLLDFDLDARIGRLEILEPVKPAYGRSIGLLSCPG